MARKKKKISFKVSAPLVPPIGHPEHISGTGAHNDRREKRKRTRAAKKRAALRDEEG